jgi:hypothetical protein
LKRKIGEEEKKKKMEEKLTKKEVMNGESVGVFDTGRSTEIEKAKKKKSKTAITTSSEVERIKIIYEINGGDEIVNRVIERMNKELGHGVMKNGSNGSINGSSKMLNMNIIQCAKGSRWWRRIGALWRIGWIVLEVEWELIDNEKGCILVKGASTLRDSADTVGIVEWYERNYGEKTLLNTLTPMLATEIKSKSLPFL